MAIIAGLSDERLKQLCQNNMKSCFPMVAEPGFGPLQSHRNSFSLNVVCFPSLGIFIAMRYNYGLSFGC